jgi:hypothetical protein
VLPTALVATTRYCSPLSEGARGTVV